MLIIPFFSIPPISRSVAISKSWEVTNYLLFLAAKRAASLQRLAIYAPLNPGVKEESLFAKSYLDRVDSTTIFFKWTLKICLLPSKSGSVTSTKRSNLPGRIKAWSSKFTLFVAAITITLASVPKPSISTKIWFKVLSLSSWEPWLPLLFLPTASISSIKIIEGDFSLAVAKRSRTLEAPTPTKI